MRSVSLSALCESVHNFCVLYLATGRSSRPPCRGRAHSSDQAIDGLPTARGPTTLSDKVGRTAAVVLPVARRLDRRVDCPDQTWVRAGGGHVSSEPMPRQLSAASPGEPRVGRPAMAS